MKYSVLGFNQEKIIKKYPELDVTDLLLLKYIWQAQAQPSMQHIIKDSVVYVWLNHAKILEDLPILNIKEDMLKRRIKKLVDLNLIRAERISNDSNRGSKAYYGITKDCEILKFSEEDTTTCKKFTVNKCSSVKNYTCSEGPRVKNYTSDSKLESYDNKLEKEEYSKEYSKKKNFELNHSVQQRDSKIVDKVIDLYLNTCTKLPKIRALTETRKKAILLLFKHYDLNKFDEVFKNANNSDFLTGNNDRGWRADFDWLMNENNFIKVLEGKYNSKAKKKLNKFNELENERCGREREVKELHVIQRY